MNQPVPDELISAYFDGEVTPEERLEIERLLESSVDFRQQLDDTSKLSALLHSFPREAAPAELAVNVQNQVQKVVVTPSSKVASGGRSLRREWTAFGVGILATMASLLMVARLNTSPIAPEQIPRLHKEVASVTREKRLSGEKLNELSDNELSDSVTIADSDHISRKSADKMQQLSFDAPTMGATALSMSVEPAKDAVANANLAASTATLSDNQFNALQSQIQKEFLDQLTNGDVIVPKVADPNNTVAVVYFVVVDTVREANDLKAVFLQRLVRQVETPDDAMLAKRDASKENDEAKDTANKKLSRPDDYQVFFVRAPGDQLASAIDEFSKNHPDLNWVPQLPIELPQAIAQQETEGLNNPPAAPTPILTQADPNRGDAEDPKAVSAEAELVFDAFLARNNQENLSVEAELKESVATDAKSKQESLARRASRSNYVAPATSQPVTNFPSDPNESAKLGLAGHLNNGYFAIQNSSQLAQKPVTRNQQLPLPSLANSTSNSVVSNNMSMGNYARYSQSVANGESRNSRPVKMLIVLKSQQATPGNSP